MTHHTLSKRSPLAVHRRSTMRLSTGSQISQQWQWNA